MNPTQWKRHRILQDCTNTRVQRMTRSPKDHLPESLVFVVQQPGGGSLLLSDLLDNDRLREYPSFAREQKSPHLATKKFEEAGKGGKCDPISFLLSRWRSFHASSFHFW